LESTLASQAAELSALQTQLSSAKAAYDTESTLLAQIKERHATQTSEIQKAREDLIRSESDLSAIRVEKAEIEQALLRDKEEARDLHRRMMETSQQADGLKVEVEKSKKEAKQQKGRLAIARKQLLTKETEKAKVEKELEEANVEVKSIVQEIQGVENQLNMPVEEPQPRRTTSPDSIAIAAAQPLPASPELVSSSKSNNPFERLATSSPRSQSPFLSFNTGPTSSSTEQMEDQNRRATPEPKSSFDDFYGVDESNTNQEENKPTQENGETVSREDDEGKSLFFHTSDPNISTTIIASPTTVADTEPFVTPPSTAKNETLSESSENFANTATARFPSVNNPSSLKDDAGTEKNQDSAHTVTDLHTNLQEVEVEEPDSDESDDDHRPLSEIAQEVKGKTSLAVDRSVNADVTIEPNGLPPSQAKDSFDNIFGSNNIPVPTSVSTSEAPKLASGTSNISTLVQPSEPPKQDATAGANAFDETLNGFSTPSPPIPGQFKFDAFEDSFDFGAAGVTKPGPPEAILSASKTAASPMTPAASTNSPLNFDDIFASPNAGSGPHRVVSAPMSNGVTPEVDPSKPTSFDDAFASFDASPNLNLEPSLGHVVPVGTSISTSMGAQSPKPFPPSSGPTSPKAVDTASSRRSMNRATSPTRSASPPIRTGSPVPRPSTSSKDSHEKKDSTRHSKLSVS
jgi:epidermal growth factor receptor substrate 15